MMDKKKHSYKESAMVKKMAYGKGDYKSAYGKSGMKKKMGSMKYKKY